MLKNLRERVAHRVKMAIGNDYNRGYCVGVSGKYARAKVKSAELEASWGKGYEIGTAEGLQRGQAVSE